MGFPGKKRGGGSLKKGEFLQKRKGCEKREFARKGGFRRTSATRGSARSPSWYSARATAPDVRAEPTSASHWSRSVWEAQIPLRPELSWTKRARKASGPDVVRLARGTDGTAEAQEIWKRRR
eukprot:1690657-Rhodomonas_salina.4